MSGPRSEGKPKDIGTFSGISGVSGRESGAEQGDGDESDAPRDVPRAHPTRIIVPVELADWLRLLLQLPYCDDSRIAPVRVDAHAFADWCLAGVVVCHVVDDAAEPWTPVLHEARKAADGFVYGLTVRRHSGNITHAAASGKTSRRAFREGLKRHGLYREPGMDTKEEPASPRLTWATVSVLSLLAATAHDPEKAVWQQAANAGIQRIRKAGRRASRMHAEEIILKLSQGMSKIAVATVIPGPVVVSRPHERVRIELGGEVMDAGPLGSERALYALTKALAQLGGPVESLED